ncbi:MAG: hypothetical protein LBR43_03370 [Spiroplasmataceae bacterium]|jgi:hypothetical protein|nr:hypothetical protein [Spiroplasmataceae bacterium]
MNNKTIIAKFKFDLDQEICWQWKDNQFIEIPQENKGRGSINNQRYFVLDKDNPNNWVNYTITYSKKDDAVWLTSWYKHYQQTQCLFAKYYKVKIKKSVDLMEVEFTDQDEVIKAFDKKKEKSRWIYQTDFKKNSTNYSLE